jgi:predicted TIM-barrel fold metal-dependent hydrolase
MADERWREGYALLAEHGLSFDLQTPWWNLEDAVRLAGDFPSVQIILNHTALPSDRSPDGLLGWRRAIEHAAEAPNICMKVSGLGEPGRPWTVERQRRIVLDAIEAFGPDRIMLASNFPVDSLCATFGQIYDGFAEITRDLGPNMQRALFHDNAVRFYRLDPAETTGAHASTSRVDVR